MIDGQHMTKSITSTTYGHGARVMLTARSADYVVGQHPARSECSASWGAPMSRIAPPDVVVCDDSSGFEKTQRDPLARPVREVVLRMGCVPRREGPRRRQGPVQAPAPQEGEAARTAVPLGPPVHVPRPGASEGRGRSVDQQPHRGDELQAERAAPEAQGHGIDHGVKAMPWWLYMRTENPMPAARIMAEMPTDESMAGMCAKANGMRRNDEAVQRWGAAVTWEEFHAREWRGSDGSWGYTFYPLSRT